MCKRINLFIVLYLIIISIGILNAIPDDKNTIEFADIPGGEYWRGIKNGENNPLQYVKVDSFRLSKYEITVQQFKEFLKETDPNYALLNVNYLNDILNMNDGFIVPENWPMAGVNFYKAVEYCNWLSRKDGLKEAYIIKYGDKEKKEYSECVSVVWDREADGYRLPTEAEWEYAARAGSGDDLITGNNKSKLDKIAWYKRENSPLPLYLGAVGTKEPNSWGLYDMLGNVNEWCWDLYDIDYYRSEINDNPAGPEIGNNPDGEYGESKEDRVLRGGCVRYPSEWIGVERRGPVPPIGSIILPGFRIARNSSQSK